MKLDKKTLCFRLEQGIPLQLALTVPAEMEISSDGLPQDLGVPLYNIYKVLACGTAEDIIEYMINTDRFDDVVYGFGVTITKVGAGIDGCPLYILRHFISGGSAKEIMDSWYDDLDDMEI